jgi:5-formyltetrahydrofolate cyclo-ligase
MGAGRGREGESRLAAAPGRRRVRKDGKLLYMAVPRPRAPEPFVLVQGDPTISKALRGRRPRSPISGASTSSSAARSPSTATTVHPLQLLDGPLPQTEHDFRLDLVVTPAETIRTGAPRRPRGILWDHLDDEKIASIPVLHEISTRS